MSPKKLLIDTNFWLELASDYRLTPLLTAIDKLISDGTVSLLVPQLVLDEFAANRDRVVEKGRHGLSSHIKHVRDAIEQFGDRDSKPGALDILDDIAQQVVVKGSVSQDAIETIDRVMSTSTPLVATDQAKLKVIDRAIARLAPFHRSKNSTTDGLLIEIFSAIVAADDKSETQYYFISRNVRDFSQRNGDQRLPHADLAHVFQADNCHYSISLVRVIRSIAPDLLEQFEEEFADFPQLRGHSELLEAEHLLELKVWYDRHLMRLSAVENGQIKIVSREQYAKLEGYPPDIIVRDIWEGARAAAKATENELGRDNLGPWSDFEWGMLNGKLSALRWVLGEDWDMLDT